MSFKKIGATDIYGCRIFNDGVEQAAGASDFEVTYDDGGVIKWLQSDLATWAVTPYAFPGAYVSGAGHTLAGFATPGGAAAGEVVTVRGFHPDIRGDASIPRSAFFNESFTPQASDLDDIEDQVLGPDETPSLGFGP